MTTELVTSDRNIRTVPVSALTIDTKVQRDRGVNITAVGRMVDTLNVSALGVLTVSERADGRLVVIDGMHRRQAVLDADIGDVELTCLTYTGLTLAQECELFRLLNRISKLVPFDDYTKGVLSGDPECVGVDAIVRGHGLRVAAGGGAQGDVRAVLALRQIYRRTDPPGQALDAGLAVITGAWGRSASNFDHPVLIGIAEVMRRYEPIVDKAVLIRKLSLIAGGPPQLIGDARLHRQVAGGSVGMNVARVVIGAYNRGKRSNALPAI